MPPSLDTRDMRLAVIGAIVIQVGVALMGRRVLGPMDQIGPTALLLAYIVLPGLAAIIWIWFAAVWRERDGWAGLGFTWTERRWLFRAAALGIFSVPALMLITALTRPILGPTAGPTLPLSPDQALSQPVYFLTMVLGIAVISPLMEEIVFRGLLFGWLRRRFGLWNAAGLAAVAHAVMHFDLGALPGLFALFLFLAWIYEYSGSLWVPAIIHGVHNFVVLQLP
ncbi:MAG: type II CAAX endopeptidase family protein [Alphaproteobacteria bacterium]|jgi:membrane protease YdiL (CAAX protease family)